jgi:hypothetical protein
VRRVSTLVVLALVFAFVGSVHAAGPDDILLAEGQRRQVIQFNPTAALQKRIFADRFVPNSSEFYLAVAGVEYAGQRAESLSTGTVRVYYVPKGDWGNVRYVQRGAASGALADALLSRGEAQQVIRFNPSAALQKGIFADGFVPNSPEFTLHQGGVAYTAQRAENLGNGVVRVYYVANQNWANVQATGVNRMAAAPPPPSAPPPGPPPVTQGRRLYPIGRSCPDHAPIKGNHSSSGEWIYHMPGQQAYNRTHPEECFASPSEAQAAGYRQAMR